MPLPSPSTSILGLAEERNAMRTTKEFFLTCNQLDIVVIMESVTGDNDVSLCTCVIASGEIVCYTHFFLKPK